MIELMKPKATFVQSEIQDGDIICFQVEMNEKEYVSSLLLYSLLMSVATESTTWIVRDCTLILSSSTTSCRIVSLSCSNPKLTTQNFPSSSSC